MLIDSNSKYLLKQTRAKAKMYEYNVPSELHIAVEDNPNELLLIAIAAIGNISAHVLRENNPYRIIPTDKKKELKFASHYFDAFLQSKLSPNYPDYYLILGAVAYYLCDFNGSAKVMADMIDATTINLNCNGIEKLLTLLLQDKLDSNKLNSTYCESPYIDYLLQVTNAYEVCFHQHKTPKLDFVSNFRTLIYAQGSPRELLLTDSLLAILLIKIERSATNLLPAYSGLPREYWDGMLKNPKSIHELWPAQIRLGEAGVFSGKSAIIQMPTSSGKTTSMSIAIRSSFLSGRTSMAIVVAPFRSLCREISADISNDFSDDFHVHINEFSDIPEMNDLRALLSLNGVDSKNILVLTPEKLLYLLRQDNELIEDVGLVIFDEAHMFDDASRGAQYELLISSIILCLKPGTQKLLISAVIPNASQINEWFTSGEGAVIADNSIRATEKSVALADWQMFQREQYGYLYFVNPENPNDLEFFVPRIIDIKPIKKLKRNEKERFFPSVNFRTSKVEHNDIAIYLALKLNHNGGVAIFCGRKDTVDGVLKRILEINARGIDISAFCEQITCCEHQKIARLIKENYGQDNVYYRAALEGVFAHHRGISNGIRIATEYAMKKNLIKCIVCTSTLAQGVNLPIRYLIISGIYQAQERIKVRDFHNLIGRAGRAGLYTEGTILFSESFVYSKRNMPRDNWRWREYLKMLNPNNSESCLSQLLLLVRPVSFKISHNNYGEYDFYNLALFRYLHADEYKSKIEDEYLKFKEKYEIKDYIFNNFVYKLNQVLDAVESYLLYFITVQKESLDIITVISHTFGYFISNEDEKEKLKILVLCIKEFLIKKINDTHKYTLFSRSLLGVQQLIEMERWVTDNVFFLINCETSSNILQSIMPQIIKYSNNKTIKAFVTTDELFQVANLWISGISYNQILNYTINNNIKIIHGNREKKLQLQDIIDVCDEGFGYSTILIINAISELLQFHNPEAQNTHKLMSELSRQMCYGLPTKESIIIYESGFLDRAISLRLSEALKGVHITSKRQFKEIVHEQRDVLMNILSDYPQIFSDKLSEI